MQLGRVPVALAAVVVSLGAAAAEANVFAADGVDPRVIQPRTGEGAALAMIGRVVTTTEVPPRNRASGEVEVLASAGTAFLVSPCLALTNHHVVFGDAEEPSARATSVFEFPEIEGVMTRSIPATPVVWGPASDSGRVADDWALLRLDECIGRTTGWLEVAQFDTDDLLELTLMEAGYSGDKDKRYLWLHSACRLYRPDSFGFAGAFFHDCASTGGNSGSPLIETSLGYPRVVLLDQGEFRRTAEVIRAYSHDQANIGVDIRRIYEEIGTLVKTDIGTTPNPVRTATAPAVMEASALSLALQRVLLRHGCYAASLDGVWGERSVGAALIFALLSDQAPTAGTPLDRPAAWQDFLYTAEMMPAPLCTQRQTVAVTLDGSVGGNLDAADFIDDFGSYADCFVLVAQPGTPVRIDVTSSSIDTFLEVGPNTGAACPDAELPEVDDDGGTDTNSRLVVTLPAGGNYLIRVSSYFEGEVGPYTLSVARGGP